MEYAPSHQEKGETNNTLLRHQNTTYSKGSVVSPVRLFRIRLVRNKRTGEATLLFRIILIRLDGRNPARNAYVALNSYLLFVVSQHWDGSQIFIPRNRAMGRFFLFLMLYGAN